LTKLTNTLHEVVRTFTSCRNIPGLTEASNSVVEKLKTQLLRLNPIK